MSCLVQPFPKQALVFTCLQYKSFENTVGKGKTARNEQFLLFPQCFLPIWITYCHFHYNLQLSSANSFSLEESKFVVWERDNASMGSLSPLLPEHGSNVLPIVAAYDCLKRLEQNLCIKLDFPTPESPTNTTLNTLCRAAGSACKGNYCIDELYSV